MPPGLSPGTSSLFTPMAAVLALALAGRLSGAASFEAYPLVKMQVGASTFVLCAALVAAVLLSFADRRGIDR